MTAAGITLVGLGSLLSLVAAIGVVRFSSTLCRLHAATKSASLGLGTVMAGAALIANSWSLAAAAVLVGVFQFVTAPIAGHLLGRAAVLAGQGGDGAALGAEPPHPQPVTRAVTPGPWLALVITWTLLWQDFSLGTSVAGAIVAYAALRLLPTPPSSVRPRPIAVLASLVRYLGLVVRSNLRVAREVLTPDDSNIREAIVDVPLETRSPAVSSLVANAISYTPGTLSVELRTDTSTGGYLLSVHTMHFTSSDDVAREVGRLETWVTRTLRPHVT